MKKASAANRLFTAAIFGPGKPAKGPRYKRYTTLKNSKTTTAKDKMTEVR